MMQGLGRRLPRNAPAAAVCPLTVRAVGLAPAVAAARSHPASRDPATGTPALATASTTEQVRQLVACGKVMYAVGGFTEISRNGTAYTRDNVFGFSQTAPSKMTSWSPDVNGTVNSIALTTNCGHAFIGGVFTEVDGSAAGSGNKYYVSLNPSTGKDDGYLELGRLRALLVLRGGRQQYRGLQPAPRGGTAEAAASAPTTC
jgi:hypothetical protein